MAEAETDPMAGGSPFWRFSVAFYRHPDVAQACIALQDGADVDVNLLLFLLWMATLRRRLGTGEVGALEARLSTWRSAVVRPLRDMRRRLKGDPPLVAAAQADAFRERVKALELEAERLQQEAMHALADGLAAAPAASPAQAARANIAAYESVKGGAFAREAVECLIAGLARE